jgi:hypothetical protein
MESHVKACAQGLVSCLRNIFRKPGHVKVLQSHNKEVFDLWNYFLNKAVARQTVNAGWCTSGGLGPSDNIDQAQSRTKLRNFG